MLPVALIVDDSLTVRMDLSEAFEAAGFRPLLAATVAASAGDPEARAVDVAILDVVLPDEDGTELLREIRAHQSSESPFVLLLSTEAEVRDRIRGIQVGADDYVGKPYDTSYVIARVRELLRSRRPAGASGEQTILVIDDSATFRAELSTALAAAHYAVVTASNGEEGLKIADNIRPTAIVVDSVMPGIDGGTVIRRIRLDAALRATPCVLLTALGRSRRGAASARRWRGRIRAQRGSRVGDAAHCSRVCAARHWSPWVRRACSAPSASWQWTTAQRT